MDRNQTIYRTDFNENWYRVDNLHGKWWKRNRIGTIFINRLNWPGRIGLFPIHSRLFSEIFILYPRIVRVSGIWGTDLLPWFVIVFFPGARRWGRSWRMRLPRRFKNGKVLWLVFASFHHHFYFESATKSGIQIFVCLKSLVVHLSVLSAERSKSAGAGTCDFLGGLSPKFQKRLF